MGSGASEDNCPEPFGITRCSAFVRALAPSSRVPTQGFVRLPPSTLYMRVLALKVGPLLPGRERTPWRSFARIRQGPIINNGVMFTGSQCNRAGVVALIVGGRHRIGRGRPTARPDVRQPRSRRPLLALPASGRLRPDGRRRRGRPAHRQRTLSDRHRATRHIHQKRSLTAATSTFSTAPRPKTWSLLLQQIRHPVRPHDRQHAWGRWSRTWPAATM